MMKTAATRVATGVTMAEAAVVAATAIVAATKRTTTTTTTAARSQWRWQQRR
jgi:hypothetical protein